jgi:hypothetical protein
MWTHGRARERGEKVRREQIAAEIVKRHPELADMIADAEEPCPLCGATGHALDEAADSLPTGLRGKAVESLTYSES